MPVSTLVRPPGAARRRLARSLPLVVAAGLAACNLEQSETQSDAAPAKPQADATAPAAPLIESMPRAEAPARTAVAGGIAGMAPPPMPQPTDDRFTDAEQNPVKLVAEEPVSTFSADVDTASYAVVRRFLREGRLPPAGAVRVEEMINYFPYALEGPRDPGRPFSTRIGVMPTPWNADSRLMTVTIKAMDLDQGGRPPLNLVLLVDVSGSMQGRDRLPLLKSAFADFARDLKPEDRISIVAYAGGVDVVLPPTKGSDQSHIQAAIEGLQAGGSTNGAGGLDRAYRLARENFAEHAVNRIILATDGDFNIGQSNPKALEGYIAEQRKSGVYLSILGVGLDNLNDNLMQKLAQAGNGNAAYVDTAVEGRKVLHDEAASTLVPVADDVKFQVEFNPAKIAEYRLIGYETRGLRRQDFNDDKVDAGDVGSGQTVTAIYEVTPVGAKPSVDPLRYGSPVPELDDRAGGSHGDEIAFLRIRYKLPGESRSRLIERPVTTADAVADLKDATADQRFAVAVAAYGQKLAGVGFVAGLSWPAIAELAQGARGEDAEGYRAEFVQLVRAADALD
ncbi:von Willebrand factor type A domain-containing protein [Zavarzinia sp.]|uniref:vWA domain-containing protein n=1 Tax=Zavarzinia sp. TaxID=2027920 RepID=UPI003565C3DC